MACVDCIFCEVQEVKDRVFLYIFNLKGFKRHICTAFVSRVTGEKLEYPCESALTFSFNKAKDQCNGFVKRQVKKEESK